ncbi:hypothetical protein GQ53DRAFT_881435 [Thozetella sp. PMI_491]|nr:hypothetical protein GQ53DRAFT_881435 [Thozetella sp. PMI_491]
MRDYSQPRRFDLSKEKLNKPVDIGLNGTSPTYVRQYRARMLQMLQKGLPGFGLRVQGQHGAPSAVTIEFGSLGTAVMRYRLEETANVVYTLEVLEDGSLSQTASISSISEAEVRIDYELDLGLSVHRASYGQLTEGGPIPLPPSENHLQLHHGGAYLTVSNKYLGAHLQARLNSNGTPVNLDGLHETVRKDRPLNASLSRTINLAPGSTTTVTAEFRLLPFLHQDAAVLPWSSATQASAASKAPQWHSPEKLETFIVRRNLDYILGNCSLSLSEDCRRLRLTACSWQWKFLMEVRRGLDRLVSTAAAQQYRVSLDRTIKGHLNWVFLRAQRPQKIWHRSYLITGRPKDGPVFQLDQQCYPFLELCDFFDELPHETEFVKSLLAGDAFDEVLGLVQTKQDPVTGLFPTDETPGDDAVEHPFHFSSHVLLWHTYSRLCRLLQFLGPSHEANAERMGSLAAQVRASTLQHFFTTEPATGEPIIAYLTDGQGHHTLYHDANDIPTIFAPKWGFLEEPSETQAWHNTMRFALSTRNTLGYASGGPFEGLGSVHSKGPWPLGYFQELAYFDATQDWAMRQAVWKRIGGAMQWDGTFGEAVDVARGNTTSKAWFSWPGSMLGAALVPELAVMTWISPAPQ